MADFCLWALMDNGHDELFIKLSAIEGKGLFTCKNLPPQTVIYKLNYKHVPPLSKNKLLDLTGINEDYMLRETVDDVLKYVNHSCKPNAYINNYGHLINTTYIFADSEINIDYADILIDHAFKVKCLCCENTCRGLIQLKSGTIDQVAPEYNQFGFD